MNVNTLKKSATVVEAYLESIGKKVKHTQALEIVARAHGSKNWNVLAGVASRNTSTPEALTEDILNDWDAAREFFGLDSSFQYQDEAIARYVGDFRRSVNKEEPAMPVCKHCGSPVLFGYCTDATCWYSDWPQNMPVAAKAAAALDGSTALEAEYGVLKRCRVAATIQDDAALTRVEFDAGPWFSQASDSEIEQLQGIGWEGDYPSDEVALFFEDTNQDIADLLSFCLGTQRTNSPIGFECRVDEDEAMNWLKFNKTQLWAKFLCAENDVNLVQAEEDEVRGRWDWLCGNEACDRSFATEGEAAMNAVLVLGLARGVRSVESEHTPLAPASASDQKVYASMADNYFKDAPVAIEPDWVQSLSVGSEVWWNDPDHGKSSGYYIVQDILLADDEEVSDNTTFVLKNGSGSEAEVYAHELAGMQPEGLYPVVVADDPGTAYGYAYSADEASDVIDDCHGASVSMGVDLLSDYAMSANLVVPKMWVVRTTNTAGEIIDLVTRIKNASGWKLADSPVLNSYEYGGYTGKCPADQVFYFSWWVDGVAYSETITEDDLAHARSNGNIITYPGEDNDETLELIPAAVKEKNSDSSSLQFLIGQPPLSNSELQAIDRVYAVVDVPFEMLGGETMDELNDYVSERLTGSIATLVDIGYQVHHITDAERALYGEPDSFSVLLRVSGSLDLDSMLDD